MIRERISRILTRISDVVMHGRAKAMILLGTDRKDTIDSGYGDGGENDPDSAVIDMVVGFEANQREPDYLTDKSRIYIAEKTNPDEYFNINVGQEVEEEPAIINVSDNLYFRARNKIKILNRKVSINIDSNGNIEITANDKAEISVGAGKISIDKNGNIELNGGQGINGNVITDLDITSHIDPITGAEIPSNFKTGVARVNNQAVKIK